MSEREPRGELARDVAALIRTLEDLQGELDPGNRQRMGLPTPRDVLRFTSEVTIPAAILVLETNVRVLRLLQRTIRMTAGDGADRASTGPAVRERAESLGRETLRGLDGVLDEVEAAIEGRPGDDEAAALLDEARRLRADVDAELGADLDVSDATLGGTDLDREPVDVDVEAELRSIRDEIDRDDGPGGGDADGTDSHDGDNEDDPEGRD